MRVHWTKFWVPGHSFLNCEELRAKTTTAIAAPMVVGRSSSLRGARRQTICCILYTERETTEDTCNTGNTKNIKKNYHTNCTPSRQTFSRSPKRNRTRFSSASPPSYGDKCDMLELRPNSCGCRHMLGRRNVSFLVPEGPPGWYLG